MLLKKFGFIKRERCVLMKFERLIICGHSHFANELLANHIKLFSDISIKLFSGHEKLEHVDLQKDALVICDCDKIEPFDHCRKISMFSNLSGDAPSIVFINVDKSVDLCRELIQYNINGVLYIDDSVDTIKKAVETILKGDYWLSRKLLVGSLKSVRDGSIGDRKSRVTVLTVREQEILGLIAAGQSNQDISERLFISLSTVKTHISNIYKKIDATNRVQAILWAAEHLYSKHYDTSVSSFPAYN